MSKFKTVEPTGIKPEVLELSTKLESGLSIDDKTGTIVEKDGADLYNKNLPEGLSPEIVKNVSDYNTTFIAAGAHAVGTMAVQAMAGHKDLDKVTGEIAMGNKDSVGFTVERSKSFTNRMVKEGEEPVEVVKYGVVTPSYDVRAGKNGGQLKSVRGFIGLLAAENLK